MPVPMDLGHAITSEPSADFCHRSRAIVVGLRRRSAAQMTAVLANKPVTCSAAMLRWSTPSLADTRQNPQTGHGYDEMAQIRWQKSARNGARRCR